MKSYDHKKIEKKWQKEWANNKIYKTSPRAPLLKGEGKYYILDMFPYPSGEGLHVGHPRGYIGTDIYSRFKRMRGFNVLHPMGFDSFGLPAENYALKHKIHPEQAVKKNIKRYKDQLSVIGFDYDWTREVVTSDPGYYKWTQWIFLKLFEHGLAYESFEPINWCPSCKTGLANEDLDNGVCERCGSPVEKKPLRQWVLKITQYADQLLSGLDELDWLTSDKEAQRNWIGRSEGAEIEFKIKGKEDVIKIFTTRADTLFGVTYVVLAPEHELIQKFKNQIQNWDEVQNYIELVKSKTEMERTGADKDKTGVELRGIKAVNPANGEEVPVWIADYVLAGYGTGAIMAVPAHDERDREFALKHNLPIVDRPLIDKEEVIKKVAGQKKVNYKLRDWVFSRQRYWGEPIPIIHCLECGPVGVPEKDLPVKLPKVKHYEPTGTGESPLNNIDKWVNTKCPKCGGPGKRETNTMPSWAGSSWYHIAYTIAENLKSKTLISKQIQNFKFKKIINHWLPINLYIGGTEHTTRHLIYARFWHKFLHDIGVVSTKEPFTKLRHQGLIMASDGRKMSKRWGNVINPDDVVKTYGADTLRLYEMFMGPFNQTVAWNTDSIIGSRRFLEKVWRIGHHVAAQTAADFTQTDAEYNHPLPPPYKGGGEILRGSASSLRSSASLSLERLLHKTIKKVTEDIENMGFNTAISSMMIFVNEVEKSNFQFSIFNFQKFLQILAPFAPHVAEELWQPLSSIRRGAGVRSIHLSDWPKYDPKLIIDETIKIAVQVNGKVRVEIEIPTDSPQDEVEKAVLAHEIILKWVEGKPIKKFIYVKNKLANIVI